MIKLDRIEAIIVKDLAAEKPKSLETIITDYGLVEQTVLKHIHTFCKLFITNNSNPQVNTKNAEFLERFRKYIHYETYPWLYDNYDIASRKIHNVDQYKKLYQKHFRDLIIDTSHPKYNELLFIKELNPIAYIIWVLYFLGNMSQYEIYDELELHQSVVSSWIEVFKLWFDSSGAKNYESDTNAPPYYNSLMNKLRKHYSNLEAMEFVNKRRIKYIYKGETPPLGDKAKHKLRWEMWFKLKRTFDIYPDEVANLKAENPLGMTAIIDYYGLDGSYVPISETQAKFKAKDGGLLDKLTIQHARENLIKKMKDMGILNLHQPLEQ